MGRCGHIIMGRGNSVILQDIRVVTQLLEEYHPTYMDVCHFSQKDEKHYAKNDEKLKFQKRLDLHLEMHTSKDVKPLSGFGLHRHGGKTPEWVGTSSCSVHVLL